MSVGSGRGALGDSGTGSSAPAALGLDCHVALVNIRVPTANRAQRGQHCGRS